MYATDGGVINGKHPIIKSLDSLIDHELIKPFSKNYSNNKIADSTSTTLGNGKKVNLTYRNFEYIREQATNKSPQELKDRFNNHMAYFKDELIPFIENELNQNNL